MSFIHPRAKFDALNLIAPQCRRSYTAVLFPTDSVKFLRVLCVSFRRLESYFFLVLAATEVEKHVEKMVDMFGRSDTLAKYVSVSLTESSYLPVIGRFCEMLP